MIEVREPVVGYAGTRVTLTDGLLGVSYVLQTHEDYEGEQAIHRNPALEQLRRLKEMDRANNSNRQTS